MLLQECRKRFRRHAVQFEALKRFWQLAILFEFDQYTAQLSIFAMFEQPLLQLGLLHALGGIQRGGKRAMFGDQLGRRFGPDAVNSRNVVHAIAHQGEDVANKFRFHAEFFFHLFDIDALAFHCVEHVDARAVPLSDKLHQILVR